MVPLARTQALDAVAVSGMSHRFLSGSDPGVPVAPGQCKAAFFQSMGTAQGADRSALRAHNHCLHQAPISDAEDLFDVRRTLEESAIRQMVERATHNDWPADDAFRTANKSGFRAFAQDDARYHLTIARLSGNRRLAQETAHPIDICDRLALPGRSATPKVMSPAGRPKRETEISNLPMAEK